MAAAGLITAMSAALPATSASADGGPSTIGGAKAQLNSLYNKSEQLDNQIDVTESNITDAQHQVTAMKKAVTTEQTNYNQLHSQLAQFAAAAYESGDTSSLPSIVAAKNPQDVLDQMSVFTQQAVNRSAALTQFIQAAQRLEWEQDQATEAVDSLHSEQNQLQTEQRQAHTDEQQATNLLDKLGGKYLVPGTTDKAACETFAIGRIAPVIDYACSKLGDPYVFGGAGPEDFDCSGLTMMAWRQVGFYMPHYVPDQAGATVPVSRADLRPGDLLFWLDYDHVTMYLGDNEMVAAPHTGTDVQVQEVSTYPGEYMGAGRPAGYP